MSSVGAMMNVTTSLAGAGGLTTFSHVGVAYQRDNADTFTHSLSAPSSAQTGDLLILSAYVNAPGGSTAHPSGWTSIGGTSGHPSSEHYYKIHDATNAPGPWSVSWDKNKPKYGSIVAFRPSAPITTVSAEQYKNNTVNGGTITSSITTVTNTVAPGPRIYFYASAGGVDDDLGMSAVTITLPSAFTTVNGQGLITNDAPNYGYRLDDTGDTFASTTVSSQCADRVVHGLFIITVT